MKKFGLIYALSFAAYPVLLFSSTSLGYNVINFETAGPLTVLALIYQIIYIVFLRKKENTALKRSIALFFLYFFLGLSVYIISRYVYYYFAGYKVYTVFPWSSPPDIYYGFEAWERYNRYWLNPYWVVILTAAYAFIYFIITKKRGNRAEK